MAKELVIPDCPGRREVAIMRQWSERGGDLATPSGRSRQPLHPSSYDWAKRYPRMVKAMQSLEVASALIDGEAVFWDASSEACRPICLSGAGQDDPPLGDETVDLNELVGEIAASLGPLSHDSELLP